MKKTFILTLVAMLMIFTFNFQGVAFASGNPTISADKVSGSSGNTVSVDITIENNPSVVLANISFGWDSDLLVLTDVTRGTALTDNTVTFVQSQSYSDNPFSAFWVSTSTTNITDNGTLLTLSFTINENAELGAYSEITLSYEEGDMLDVDLVPVDFEISNGKITVAEPKVYHTVTFVDELTTETISTVTVEHGKDATLPTPPEHEGFTFTGWSLDGKNITEDTTIMALYESNYIEGDSNGDGVVNTGDAVLILRAIIGGATLNEVQKLAADMNSDGVINTGDAVAILQAVVSKSRTVESLLISNRQTA
ncbi:MAG: hypothetical protein GX802_02715 [Clostridiales bacterium]|nr:hypothetical protein [Clostridiales bacterium]